MKTSLTCAPLAVTLLSNFGQHRRLYLRSFFLLICNGPNILMGGIFNVFFVAEMEQIWSVFLYHKSSIVLPEICARTLISVVARVCDIQCYLLSCLCGAEH